MTMSLPETLATRLEDEEAVASVPLGGDDRLVVTATRTLVYRSEGLLSDESVDEYPHGAERLSVSEGRRKAKITFDYGLDGERTVSLPAKRLDDALHPVLAGTLSAAGITETGESALRTFRFSELTLVVTSARVVKHIGAAVWDDDYEEYHYDDVTDLAFEEGSVATSVVLTIGGRQERFKAPNDQARALRETLVDALCDHYGVSSLEEFRVAVEPDDEGEERETEAATDPTDFGAGPDPLSADPAEPDDDADTGVDPLNQEAGTGASTGGEPASPGGDAGDIGDVGDVGGQIAGNASDRQTGDAAVAANAATTGSEPEVERSAAASEEEFEETFEPATAEGGELEELLDQVERLHRTVERQGSRLDRQSKLIEQLIEELRRGR